MIHPKHVEGLQSSTRPARYADEPTLMKSGERVTMPNGDVWFHPYDGGAPWQERSGAPWVPAAGPRPSRIAPPANV